MGIGIIYEACMQEDEFYNSKVIKDLDKFKSISDIIVANRIEADVSNKIYTRDIF